MVKANENKDRLKAYIVKSPLSAKFNDFIGTLRRCSIAMAVPSQRALSLANNCLSSNIQKRNSEQCV